MPTFYFGTSGVVGEGDNLESSMSSSSKSSTSSQSGSSSLSSVSVSDATITSAENDILNWWTLGLPIAAVWPVGGFTPTWQYQQITASGRRILPTIFLPYYDLSQTNCTNPKTLTAYVENHLTAVTYFGTMKFPVCLRTNNIVTAMQGPRYRLPIAESSIPASAIVWKYTDGVLGDRPMVDMFGPTSNWTTEGALWGASAYMTRLYVLLDDPDIVIHLENNEGGEDDVKMCTNTLPGNNVHGDRNREWKTYADLTAIHVRMRDYVQANLGFASDPWDWWPNYWTLRNAQYDALYDAFDAQTPASWGIMVRAGYGGDFVGDRSLQYEDTLGPFPKGERYDCGSKSDYIGGGTISNLMVRHHYDEVAECVEGVVWREASHDQTYLELSLAIGDSAVVNPALAGIHKVVDTQVYFNFIRWKLWLCQKPGRPVCMRWYENFATTPTSLKFTESQIVELNSLGRSDMATLTAADYFYSVTDAIDQICTNATLRDYWLNGTSITWEPDGAEEETWLVGRMKAGVALVYAFSPVASPASVVMPIAGIGNATIQVPAFGGGYFLVSLSGSTVVVTPLDVGD